MGEPPSKRESIQQQHTLYEQTSQTSLTGPKDKGDLRPVTIGGSGGPNASGHNTSVPNASDIPSAALNADFEDVSEVQIFDQ